jgi:hypothetical protein
MALLGLRDLDGSTNADTRAAFLGYIGGGGLPRQNILKYFDRLGVMNVS